MKKILDHGFIRLVESMGDDNSAVQAARVSIGKGLKGEGPDKLLIKYLMDNSHETPFEHIVFKFHIKCPLFVARQWFRHRIASYNEISYRYTEAEREFYSPEIYRSQSKGFNKQDSTITFSKEISREFKQRIDMHNQKSLHLYNSLLHEGVAREMARMVLPVNLYTQFYWTINARSLMNFIRLRSDLAAQFEIRQYSLAIEDIFKEKCPWTYDAFREKNNVRSNPPVTSIPKV